MAKGQVKSRRETASPEAVKKTIAANPFTKGRWRRLRVCPLGL